MTTTHAISKNTHPNDDVESIRSSGSTKVTAASTVYGLHSSISLGGSGHYGSGHMLRPEDFVNSPSIQPKTLSNYNSHGKTNSGRYGSDTGLSPLLMSNTIDSSSVTTRRRKKTSSYSRKASYSKGSYSKLVAIDPRSSKHTSHASRSGGHGLQELTINKLRYAEVDFYGREEELATMQQAFKDSFDNSAREFLLLSGRSGTGKTRLCHELYKSIKGGFYFNFHGKYNRSNNLPYAGFALACEKFIAFLYILKAAEISSKDQDVSKPSRDNKSTTGQERDEIPTDLRHSVEVRTHSSRFRTSLTESFSYTPEKPSIACVFTYSEIVGQLREDLDTQEVQTLMKFIPIFHKLFDSSQQQDVNAGTENSTAAKDDDDDYAQQNLRFVHAFKKFIRIVATFSPLIITLDDLQWSDQASLKLIEALVTDFENGCGTLFIGCYRSEEVAEGHFLLKFADELEETIPKFDGAKFTQIHCGNLNVDNINSIIVDLMSDDSGRTKELAELVHRKTMGNALFAIQYLSSLADDMHLLTFNLGTFEWCWNLEEIDIATSAADNVVDLLIHRLKRLPDGVTRYAHGENVDYSLLFRNHSTPSLARVENLYKY